MRRIALFVALAIGLSTETEAAPFTFDWASGNHAASVTFNTSGTDLVVTLQNTSTADALIPLDILTGLFFDISDFSGVLTGSSAVLSLGSAVLYDSAPVNGVVGGEWAYASGIGSFTGQPDYGISSAGLGVFGGPGFPGANLDGPTAVNGLSYGITSAGDNPLTGNGALVGNGQQNLPTPLIQNSVIFTLSGLSAGFDPSSSISNVYFQYGTALATVPEPSALLLMGTGVAFALAARRRTQRKKKAQLES